MSTKTHASKKRGRWITWGHFGVIGADGQKHFGHLLWLKNFDPDFGRNGEAIYQAVADFFAERGQHHVLPIKETIEFSTTGQKLDGWKMLSLGDIIN
jgi:hypothetical protein